MRSGLRLGFVGFGEVGYELAKGLRAEGAPVAGAWKRPPWSDRVKARAAEAGVDLFATVAELVSRSDMVWAVVTASASIQVAELVAPHMADKLFVDMNSVSPMSKEKAAAAVVGAGGQLVDAALMGALSAYHLQVPTLLSGPGAEELAAAMKGWKMDVEVVGDRVGVASAIKMFRSVYMKGIEALAIETLIASRRYGVVGVVLASLEESFRKYGFRALAAGILVSNALHGERRAQEMEQVVQTLEELGIDPYVSEGTLRRLRWSADLKLREHFGGQRPSSHEDVLAAIEEILKFK